MIGKLRFVFSTLIILTVSSALAMPVLGGSVLYIDDDAPLGGDGLTWETSYRFLQDALMFAAEPENGVSEIRTAQGVYRPDRSENNPKGDGDREKTFQLINGVSLLGGYAGIGAADPDERDIEQYETILSGDLLSNDEADFKNNDENSVHVVTGGLTDNSAVIDGFTITKGNANSGDSNGAGMINYIPGQSGSVGSPKINRCVFIANRANSHGGGIYSGQNSNPQITNCIFIANWGALGGGLFDRGNAIINNCVFIDNTANCGGGISLIGREQTIINCSFFDNVAYIFGGGMFISAQSLSNLKAANCILSRNTANCCGGGIYFQGSGTANLIDVTVTNNTAGSTIGGISFSGNLRVSNSVIWGNENGQISDFYDPDFGETITYNCIEGGYKGMGNIGADPLFVDPESDDYRLLPGSPCIDSGFNNAVPRDSADLDSDDDFKEFIPFDFDGNPRFINDPASSDVGCGVIALVDMGAFEFQDGRATQPIPGDFDGDGVITLEDLIELLSEWGQCDSCCLADLDVNGSVSTSDLLLFFSLWN